MDREELRQKIEEELAAINKEAMNKGCVIEMGWLLFAKLVYPHGMTKDQHDQLRDAFFAGAHHLFSSLMDGLDLDDDDATAADEKRMELIADELDAFYQRLRKRYHFSDDMILPEHKDPN